MSIQDSVITGNVLIPYSITFSRNRRTIVIIVHQTGNVEVKAPSGVPVAVIRDLVIRKSRWVLKKKAELESIHAEPVMRTYREGDSFPFLGTELYLAVAYGDGEKDARLTGDRLLIAVPGNMSEDKIPDYIRARVVSWYREQATRIISRKVLEFSADLGIDPPKFRIKHVKKRWGSCSHRDQLNFNLKIVMAPTEQLEYVVMHELCHIRHKNHSPRFWAYLGKIMPDYLIRKEELRRDGWRYIL